MCVGILGLLNISRHLQINALEEPSIVKGRECSKKFVQQGRSRFDARSVLIVREHGKRARTPLAAFFNIPILYQEIVAAEQYIIRIIILCAWKKAQSKGFSCDPFWILKERLGGIRAEYFTV